MFTQSSNGNEHAPGRGDDRSDGRWVDLLSVVRLDAPPPDEAVLQGLRAETAAAFEAAARDHSTVRRHAPGRRVGWALATCGAAAAAVLVLALLVSTTARPRVAYAMADVPNLLRGARTLHVQSYTWSYGPDPQFPSFEKVTILPQERWIDVPGVRRKDVSFAAWSRADGSERGIDAVEQVASGELTMTVRHNRKEVTYSKRTLLTQRLASRHLLHQTLHLLSPDQVAAYKKVGREQLGGRTFDLWQRTHEGTTRRREPGKEPETHKYTARVKCWLAPDTGEVGRVEQWTKHEPTGMWRPSYFLEKVERDVPLPEEKFATTPPKDYKVVVPADKPVVDSMVAWAAPVGDAGDVLGHVAFTLEDGSVIAGWSVRPRDKDGWEKETEHPAREEAEKAFRPKVAEMQRPVFAALKAGGPLPELPVVVAGLRSHTQPYWPDEEITYSGRHLASTVYEGRFVEWGLYVPDRKLAALPPNCVYVMRVRESARREERDFNPVYGHPIRGREEFDEFVRGAIAERSADGQAPAELTYENVTRLAEEARRGR
jgi:hypothetical protein